LPKPHLNREKIVAAAIQIADDQGLDAVSLRNIAKKLDVHVTSLYNHIPSKDAVLEAMIDSLVAEAELPVGSITWQDWVRRFAFAMRASANRHPGAFQLFLRRPAQGMPALESLESAAAAFRSDGFDAVATFCAIKAVNVSVVGLVLDDLVSRLSPSVGGETNRLPRDDFPHILEIHQAGRAADSFAYVLDALISGISAKRESHGSTSGERGG
jgi:AcrR family transcriptional regulator